MIMRTVSPNKRGFTLVELMIAMSIFSFILLFAVNTFVQINKIYIKGVTTKRMNDQASSVIEELARGLQQTTSPVICSDNDCTASSILSTTEDDTLHTICLPGGASYQWKLREAGKLVSGDEDICGKSSVAFSSSTKQQKLIDGNSSVQALNIKAIKSGTVKAWQIDLVLSTQRSDQLAYTGIDPLTMRCKGDVSDQFCGVAKLSTIARLATDTSVDGDEDGTPGGPVAGGVVFADYYPNEDMFLSHYLEGNNSSIEDVDDRRSVLTFQRQSDGSFRQYNYGPNDYESGCHWDAMRWTIDGLEYFQTHDKCNNDPSKTSDDTDNNLTYTPGVIILPPSSWHAGDSWSKSGTSAVEYVDNTLKCPGGASFSVTGTNNWSVTMYPNKVEIAPAVFAYRSQSLQTTTWDAPNCVISGQRVEGDVSKYEENYYFIDDLPVSGGTSAYALKRDVGGNITSPGNPVGDKWQFDVWFDSWEPLPEGWTPRNQ